MAIYDGFFGVFNKRGELEAIESTQDAADISALNLSPKSDGRPQLNRTVRPVLVLDETVDLTADDIDRIIRRVKERIHADKAELDKAIGAELLALKHKASDPGAKTEL
jgi:CBS-domain-containing membrane protein